MCIESIPTVALKAFLSMGGAFIFVIFHLLLLNGFNIIFNSCNLKNSGERYALPALNTSIST